jgi:hypothetical protein
VEEHDQDKPQFARARSAAELRVHIDQELINSIDAEVIARGGEAAGVYRATIVTEILTPWRTKKLHDATVWLRVAGGNPTPSDTSEGRA